MTPKPSIEGMSLVPFCAVSQVKRSAQKATRYEKGIYENG
jgi:hypothetical protein